MADDDDEVEEGTPFDPTFTAPGPRRSTFTPPTASTRSESMGTAAYDDDELANALAADFGRVAPAPAAPPVQEPARAAEPPADPEPAPAPLTEPEPVRAPEPEPAHEPADSPEPPPAPEPTPATPPAPPAGISPPPTAEPPFVAPAPWSSLPAPDPSQAVDLPEGPPQRPARRSLADDELLTWVDQAGREPGGTLNVIEQLESQLRMREEEAREFSAWENTMLSLGIPDAEVEVDEDRPDFTGVLPELPEPVADVPIPTAPEAASFVMPEAPVADWPAPDFEQDTVEAPRVERPAPPLPAWEVPAPSATWAPGPEFGIDPEPTAYAVPEAAPQPEPEATADPVASAFVQPEAFVEPDVEPVFEPVLEHEVVYEAEIVDPDSVEPEWAFVPEPELAPEPVLEPAPEAEPETAPVAEPEPPAAFTPPPLVEPPQFPGPPLLPSQAHSQPADTTPGFSHLASNDNLFPPPPPPPVPLSPAPSVDTADSDIIEAEVLEDDPVADESPFDFATASRNTAAGAAAAFSFDDLLKGGDEVPAGEEPLLRTDPEPQAAADSGAESLFIEPMPVSAGEPVPTDTGSVTIVEPVYEEELPDDVDDVDRVFPPGLLLGPVSVDTAGIALTSQAIPLPSGPISTVKIPEDEVVLLDNEPVRQRVFSIEDSALDPTPVDHRVGRAARMFWLWFAANSSILSLGLGASIFAVGMSLRQSIVSVLAGVALSFIPLGLTTLAGKRSGQPTMVVSRATFGVIGNVVPATIALITRVFWGAVLLWLLASSVAIVLVGAGLSGGFGDRQLLLISLAVAFVIALLVAFAGYPLFARMQLILSVITATLVVGLIAMTAKYINLSVALSTPDGPWLMAVTGAVLVFSFVGLVWANSGADLARYQRVGSSGAGSMLWATVGATLPTFLLIGYGALLAASDPSIAEGFLQSPLDTLSLMLPLWYPIPLIAAAGLSLLSGVALSLYSGGFALQSIGVRVRRQWSIVIVGVLLAVLALVLTFGVTGGINELFRDVATTLAVPTAAWAGLFAAETMIRNRRFESQSLTSRGGIYGDVRWGNLIALILITVLGFGLTTATISWLSWQGYVFSFFGVALDSDLGGTDLGVIVALGLGILFPIIAGIPAIRRQESARA